MDINQALKKIQDDFGKGTIMRLGDKPAVDVGVISTQCPSLDTALGIGGIPKGRITEIFGPESAGKSTLCLHIIAEAQAQGGNVAYIDTEYAFDKDYAEKLGVDVENLLISQPDSAQQVFEIISTLLDTGQITAIVVDSVAAMVTEQELAGEFGDSLPGIMARLMSQACRMLVGKVSKTNTAVIFVNQIREKIGITYGSNETTPGGRALKFYSSIRLDIRRIGQVKAGEEVIGNRTKVKTVKNKCAPPFKTAEFDIIFNQGISKESDLIEVAIEKGILVKKGAWISYGDVQVGQGKLNSVKFLKENQDICDEITQKCNTSNQ
jgi:recombination protein RecA